MSSDDLTKFAIMVYKKKQKLVQMEKNLMMKLLTRDFRVRRDDQLERLKQWQDEINKIAQGRPPVKVENNVDLDEPPVGFTYITQCKVQSILILSITQYFNFSLFCRPEKVLLFLTIQSLVANALIASMSGRLAVGQCQELSPLIRRPVA